MAVEIRRIELFGGLRFRCGARVVERFPRRKAAVLLAYLALHPGQRHAREALIELFWPDSDLDAARQNLSQMLYLIRQTLGEDGLHMDRTTVTLAPEIETDVRLFEAALNRARFGSSASVRDALTDALQIANAEMLPGFYDDWAIAERERLAALREGARERLAALPESPPFEARLVSLPAYLTRRIGRETDVARVAAHLTAGARWVTLAGMGGIGKTRLAVAVGEQFAGSLETFADGVVFVDMSMLPVHAAEELLWRMIAEALCLVRADESLRAACSVVLTFLESRSLLLILDNAEHVRDTAADVAGEILSAARRTACLFTSREALQIPGETVFPVMPLADDAVLLFTDRAQAVRPDFLADAETVDLCRQLDGLPLAIEFVAARVRHLSVAEICERLRTDSHLVLAQGGRGRAGRHETMRATLAWSYGLLTPDEQRLFARLSIFSGGWTLSAAQEICEADAEALYSLIDKSLVLAQPTPGGVTRFRFMETVRAFAEEMQATLEPTTETLRQKQVAFFLAQIESGVCTTEERENVRAALVHADVTAALGFLAHVLVVDAVLQDSIWLVHWGRTRLGEIADTRQDALLARALCEFSTVDNSAASRTHLERAIQLFDRAGDIENSVGAHLRLAQHLVFFSGRTGDALRLLDEADSRRSHEPIWELRYLLTRGIALLYARAYQPALDALQAALRIATTPPGQNEATSPFWAGRFAAVTHLWTATALHWMGRLEDADRAYDDVPDAAFAAKGRALLAVRRGQADLARALGDRAVAKAMGRNGDVFHTLLARLRIERRLGDFPAMRAFLAEALQYAALEDRFDSHVAIVLADLAWARLGENLPEEAARIYGCRQAQEAREGIAADGADPDDPAALPDALRAALSASEYENAMAAGRALSVKQGIALGLSAAR